MRTTFTASALLTMGPADPCAIEGGGSSSLGTIRQSTLRYDEETDPIFKLV